MVISAGNWRFVIFFTRLETGVLEGMGYIVWRVFRRIVAIDAAIGVARIVWRFVFIMGWIFIVGIVIRQVVRPVAVVPLITGMMGSAVFGSFCVFLTFFFGCHVFFSLGLGDRPDLKRRRMRASMSRLPWTI
jgi:hypothetical protein